jgi:uncharacterized protein involved in outer membrane biogenesis
LLLKAGVLQLDPLQAVVAGGRISGSTRLDANQLKALWSADLSFSGIDVAGWIHGVNAKAVKGGTGSATGASPQGLKRRREAARQGGAQAVQDYLTGELGGHIKAEGQGRSTSEILSTLDGNLQLLLRDGTLSHLVTEAMGLDLAQALGVWVRGDRPLPLRCARLELQSVKGVVRTRVAVIDNKDSTIRVTGQIDMRDETMALRATVLPKDFSPLSLRAPLTVSGTLAKPVVGLDAQQLGGKVLGAAALGMAVAPLAALIPLLDLGRKPTTDPCSAPPPAAAARKPAPVASAPKAAPVR